MSGGKWNLGKPAAYEPPEPDGTKFWKKPDHLDHLHVFLGIELRKDVQTQYGVDDAAHCEWLICVDHPQVWSNADVFGKRLVPQLTGDPDVTEKVGRLGQGQASGDNSPPWVLDDPTSGDLDQVNAFLDRYAHRLPSGTLIIDVKAIEAAAAAPDDNDPDF